MAGLSSVAAAAIAVEAAVEAAVAEATVGISAVAAVEEATMQTAAISPVVDEEEEVMTAEGTGEEADFVVATEADFVVATEAGFVVATEAVSEGVTEVATKAVKRKSACRPLGTSCGSISWITQADTVGRNGIFPQPDAEVVKLENQMVKSSLSTALAKTSIESQLPSRPAYGTAGKPIVLFTNYFELKGIKPDTILYRYNATLSDPGLPKPKKRRVFDLLLKTEPFARYKIASDGAQTLIATEKIALEGQSPSFEIEWYPRDGEPLPAKTEDDSERLVQHRKKSTYRVLVEEGGSYSLQDLLKDLAQPTSTYPLKLETIQALNIIMAYGPSSDANVATATGNKFYPFGNHPQLQVSNLGLALQAVRGYFSSVRTSVNRILVNVNVATGAFYKPGPLLELMKERGIPSNVSQYKQMGAFFRKLRFETNYILDTDNKGKTRMGENGPMTKRKVHAIGDFSPYQKTAENVTFDEIDKNGKHTKVSVKDYFLRKYNIKLTAPDAPLVNYGTTKEPKWIPVELCSVLPGQLAKRLLQGSQTTAMIKFAARRPHENAQSIMNDGLKVTKINPISNGLNTNLTPFGIKMRPGTVNRLGATYCIGVSKLADPTMVPGT